MKGTTKKPTKNDELLKALKAKHPTTRREAEEAEDDDPDASETQSLDDDEDNTDDDAPVTQSAKAKARAVVTHDEPQPKTPVTTMKPSKPQTSLVKSKPSTIPTASGVLSIPTDANKIRAIINNNVSTEEIVAEAIKDALRGIGAFHKWTPNAKTRFRIVPIPVKGMLPVAVTWSHFDEENKRSNLCPKKMAGLDCDQCDSGDRPKRSAWAIGYVYDGSGKNAKPIYEPKILIFRGQAYTGLFDSWSEDKTMFDIDEGVDGTYSIEGSGLTSKHSLVMARSQTTAFPDDETLMEFYAKVPLDEYMRSITYTAKAEAAANHDDDDDDEDDAEYADA